MNEHMNTPWTYNNDSGRIEGQHQNPKMGPVHIADMRGWGYLTGLTEGYALSLSEAEAMEVQRRRGELLAAAPDLLAALKEVVADVYGDPGDAPQTCPIQNCSACALETRVRAVIARVEGGDEQ